MKKRVTVITSLDITADQLGLANPYDQYAENNHLVWIFKTEDEAYRATVAFMNANVPYVQRIV